MSNQQQGLTRRSSDGLAVSRAEELAGHLIKTPQELAQRIREMQQVAHVLSPAIAISSIAPQYAVNTAVVVIDTSLPAVEYGSAAGSDVYYQSSIHDGHSRKVGDEWTTDVIEVSLNKNGLLKILSAAGVDITRSARTDDGRQPYYWAWATEGAIVDFDGRRRQLPPGNVEIDYRDGAASIGEWSPDKWAPRVAAAEERRKKARNDAESRKIKPEAINGWSEDRVRNARRFGLRIAEAESLNRLIRNLGVKQKYTLAELQKPFVIFRCSFMPDMTDPEVRRIVTAAHMGATQLLYPAAPSSAPALPAADAAAGNYIDVHSSSPGDSSAGATASSSTSSAPAATPTRPPSGAVELDDIPDDPPPASTEPTYLITRVSLVPLDGRDHYFFETREGRTFVTDDKQAARALNAARKAERSIPIESERVEINHGEYFRVIDCPPASATGQASLPDPKNL